MGAASPTTTVASSPGGRLLARLLAKCNYVTAGAVMGAAEELLMELARRAAAAQAPSAISLKDMEADDSDGGGVATTVQTPSEWHATDPDPLDVSTESDGDGDGGDGVGGGDDEDV